MTRLALATAPLLAATLFAAGCAPAPTLPTASRTTTDCNQLRTERAQVEADKLAATEQQQNAWKVVVPFAVAARYASGKSALEAADKRLAALDAESARRGCTRNG